MRIFVGYGYNERDKWIEDYVFPLLAAMQCEIMHGKVVYGGGLPAEIVAAIRLSDAMIGFTTSGDNLTTESIEPTSGSSKSWLPPRQP